MGSKNKMAINYSNEGLNELLLQFQKAIIEGKYTERIPYNDWRKIKKMSFAVIEYESPFVWIKERLTNMSGIAEYMPVLSYKSYDNGFGRFFYDIYVKEQRNMDCKTVSVKLNEDSPTGTAYWTYDESLNLTNTHLYDNTSLTVSGVAIAEGTVCINDCGGWDTVATTSNTSSLEKRIINLENNMKNNENEENVKMKGFNFDFGPVNSNNIRMSMYGLAVKNASGTWVSFDPNTTSIMDVDIFNFDGAKFMWRMPVALSAVQVGDVVIHARKPMFVTSINPVSLTAVDPVDGEIKEIMLTKSPFGFNFVTKVVNLMGGFMNAPASAENPFGNMWMMMAAMNDETKDMDPMMLMLMMSASGGIGLNGINPMMLYAMMGDKKSDDKSEMFKWMIMSQMLTGSFAGLTPATEHKCSCGGNCHKSSTDNNKPAVDNEHSDNT